MLRVNVKCITSFSTHHGVRSISSPVISPVYLADCLSLSLSLSVSSAYNWIRVRDRGPVGSEIKEGRLSLHLR